MAQVQIRLDVNAPTSARHQHCFTVMPLESALSCTGTQLKGRSHMDDKTKQAEITVKQSILFYRSACDPLR